MHLLSKVKAGVTQGKVLGVVAIWSIILDILGNTLAFLLIDEKIDIILMSAQ